MHKASQVLAGRRESRPRSAHPPLERAVRVFSTETISVSAAGRQATPACACGGTPPSDAGVPRRPCSPCLRTRTHLAPTNPAAVDLFVLAMFANGVCSSTRSDGRPSAEVPGT